MEGDILSTLPMPSCQWPRRELISFERAAATCTLSLPLYHQFVSLQRSAPAVQTPSYPASVVRACNAKQTWSARSCYSRAPAGRLIIHALSHLNYTAQRWREANCRAAAKIALGLLIAADLIYNMQYKTSHLDAFKWIIAQAICSTRKTSRLPSCLDLIGSQSDNEASRRA